jgi:hypothetical protein
MPPTIDCSQKAPSPHKLHKHNTMKEVWGSLWAGQSSPVQSRGPATSALRLMRLETDVSQIMHMVRAAAIAGRPQNWELACPEKAGEWSNFISHMRRCAAAPSHSKSRESTVVGRTLLYHTLFVFKANTAQKYLRYSSCRLPTWL